MQIEITKAVIKSRILLSYEYNRKIGDVREKISTNSDAPIHPDLQECFQAFIPHFALLTEEVKSEDVKNAITVGEQSLGEIEKLSKFDVAGVSVSGTDDAEGITIMGQKTLSSGKKINFNTPFTRLFDDSTPYAYQQELSEALSKLKEEVILYMEGKQAEKAQTEFDFGEDSGGFELVSDDDAA
jgi:hypothetical protein